MDDQSKINDDKVDTNNIPLGGGVNVIQENNKMSDDVEFESYSDDEHGGGEESPQDKIKTLRKKLNDAVQEKQEYLDGWQRVKADFVNYKKREDEGKEEFIKFARESLITDLLPVLESFHMAFANKEAWEKVDPSWRKGVEYIHTQFSQILEGHGLAEIDPIGKEFNPNEHTAVGNVHTTDREQLHKIAEVVQKGYRLSGKMVKSPKVKIYSEDDDATIGERKE